MSTFIEPGLVIKSDVTGPLTGHKVAVKDIFNIRGHVTGFGSPAWKSTHSASMTTAPAVTQLLAHGAELHLTAAMDELAYSLNGENAHYGTPVNNAAKNRIPGGSSSGSAAAVCSGSCSIGLGSDTGGSVRVPSSYCGLFGIRPTWGIVDMEHTINLAPSFDTIGWMTKDINLLRTVGSIIIPSSTQKHHGIGQKWKVPSDVWELADESVQYACYDKIKIVKDELQSVLGPMIENKLVPDGNVNLTDWAKVFQVLQGYEIWREHGEWVSQHWDSFGPGIKERLQIASTITKEQVENAQSQLVTVQKTVNEYVSDGSIMMVPTAATPPPMLNCTQEGLAELRVRLLTLTSIAGLCQLPQINLPIGTTEDGPVGLSIIGPKYSDSELLDIAVKAWHIISAK